MRNWRHILPCGIVLTAGRRQLFGGILLRGGRDRCVDIAVFGGPFLSSGLVVLDRRGTMCCRILLSRRLVVRVGSGSMWSKLLLSARLGSGDRQRAVPGRKLLSVGLIIADRQWIMRGGLLLSYWLVSGHAVCMSVWFILRPWFVSVARAALRGWVLLRHGHVVCDRHWDCSQFRGRIWPVQVGCVVPGWFVISKRYGSVSGALLLRCGRRSSDVCGRIVLSLQFDCAYWLHARLVLFEQWADCSHGPVFCRVLLSDGVRAAHREHVCCWLLLSCRIFGRVGQWIMRSGLLLSCRLVVALAVPLYCRLLLPGFVIRQHWFGPVSNWQLLPCRLVFAVRRRPMCTRLLLPNWCFLGAANHVPRRLILRAWPDIATASNLQGRILLWCGRVVCHRQWNLQSRCMVSGRLDFSSGRR
jgi:hypothetical protein